MRPSVECVGTVRIPLSSTATVVYRMTSLGPEGDAFVRDFEDGYEAFLRRWEEDIRRCLVGQSGG